ncbi:hypothetical protein SLS53_009340 [Cytospora paraplurivora]|uniref:Amine oxidase domain-containing protein n=1 Tax=Cytospora paraplurivora TaxID=2898453 RepID=A0AAN9TZ31_9PEZI
MEYDSYSVREYLLTQGSKNAEIDWLEVLIDATGHYDAMSMSQSVLEEWIFTSADINKWTAINGGMDMITKGLSPIVKNKPIIDSRVTAITSNAADGTLNITVNTTTKPYAYVISTVPLETGFKFKSHWDYDSLIRMGLGRLAPEVLPERIQPHLGTTQAPYQPNGFDELVTLTLRNLASRHNVSIGYLSGQLEGAYAYDWYQSAYLAGAFAIFGPEQFGSVMLYLMTPAQAGHMHWGGETLSSGHAWITGALNSAYRNAVELQYTEGLEDKKAELVRMWGVIDEDDMGWCNWTP